MEKKDIIILMLIPIFLFLAMPTLALSDKLLQLSDLTYLGAFRVPAGSVGTSTFEYSDDGLAYYPAHNSLFLKSHTYDQMVAEISIPALVNSTNINDLKTATVLQSFADITEDNLNPQNIANGMIMGGLLVYNSRLIGSEWAYYDGSGTQAASHFTSGLTLSTTGDYRGMYKVGNLFPAFVGGYMTQVPQEWQLLLGGSALTGHCCTSIISHQSWGPSASSFDPDKLGVTDPVPATPLVYYSADHPTLGSWVNSGPANPIYSSTSEITGIVFPQGTRSILFFGRTGLGAQCYGEGGACNDPVDPYKGCHGYPYAHYIWAYDANDLVSVKNGQKNPWDIKPYFSGVFHLPFEGGAYELNGAAYDPATQRIYVSQKRGDGVLPVIHVFSVKVDAVPSTNITGDLNSDGIVDLSDLQMIVNDFDKTTGFNPKSDCAAPYNSIDLFDVMVIVKNWSA